MQLSGKLHFVNLLSLISFIDCVEKFIIYFLSCSSLYFQFFCNRNALTLSFKQILLFKLVDGCNHSQHEFSGRRTSVQILLIGCKLHIFYKGIPQSQANLS